MSDCKCIPVNVCIDENELPAGGISKFTGLPILSVIPTLSSVPPPGFVFINKPSGLIERTAYPAVWDELQKTNNTGILVDEKEYQAEIAKFGFCAKFSRGDGLETFRFPQLSGSWPGWADFADSNLQAGTAMNDQVQGFNFGTSQENQKLMAAYNNRSGTVEDKRISTLVSTSLSYIASIGTGGFSHPTYVEDQYGNGEPRIGDHTRPRTTLLNAAMKVADDYTNASEANMAAMADGYAHKLDISTYKTNNTFSKHERLTGQYWFDGKPIYQSIVNTGNIPSNSTYKLIPHNIASIDTIVGCRVLCSHPQHYVWDNGNRYFSAACNKNAIYIEGANNWNGYTGIAIVDYTKTTDLGA